MASATRTYTPDKDSLLKAASLVNIIDNIDQIDRRDRQSQMQEVGLHIQAAGLELDRQRVNLANVEAQRRQDEDALKLWNKSRSETAASFAAAEVPKIDLDHPDGEKQLGNWMSYAQAEGVSEDSIRAVFEPRLRELGVKKESRAREQAATLGGEGLSLYNAFNKLKDNDGNPLMDPERATELAIQSKQARETLSYYQKLAADNKAAFILTNEDWAKIRKRVGKGGAVQVPTSSGGANTLGNGLTEEFDPRPVYYDLDAVTQVISERLGPQLKSAQELAAKEDAAKLTTAQAEAVIKTKEAGSQGDIRKNAAAMGQIASGMQDLSGPARDNAVRAIEAITTQFPGATQGAPANTNRAEKTKADGF